MIADMNVYITAILVVFPPDLLSLGISPFSSITLCDHIVEYCRASRMRTTPYM